MTSDRTPNNPFDTEETAGQPDLLKRLPAGTYILEEISAPWQSGYVKAEPVGVTVEESAEIKSVEVKDDTTKIYIEKIDGPAASQVKVLDMDQKGRPITATVSYPDPGLPSIRPGWRWMPVNRMDTVW